MTHVRARFALLALVGVGLFGAFIPAQANALVSYYNCVNKPSNQWCDGRGNGSFDGLHTWKYNQASNPGPGSSTVCQALYRPSDGAWFGGTCFTNFISDYYSSSCACLEANALQASGSPKSVNGFADTF
jgi:hypothetical protein